MAPGLATSSGELRRLQAFERAPLNFDPATIAARTLPWKYDERVEALHSERPGDPEGGGTWEIARRLMRGYEFADPSLVRAVYDPEHALEGRTMLLQINFHGVRFHAGCRVAEVYDRSVEEDGRPVRLWGWSYRTLAGHFERGEMHWQVLKYPDTGEVAFRLKAWHLTAERLNPVIRLGITVFGRREQLRFYASTCQRMRTLTDAVASGATGEDLRSLSERSSARRSADIGDAHDRLAHDATEARRP